jgi:hypothetical protein
VPVLKENLIIETPDNTLGNPPPVKWTYKISVDDNNNYTVQLTNIIGANGQVSPIATEGSALWKNDAFTPFADGLVTSGLSQDKLNKTVFQELQTVAKANTKANQVPLPVWAKTTGGNNATPPGQTAQQTPVNSATANQQQNSWLPDPLGVGQKVQEIENLIQSVNSTLQNIKNPIDAINKVVGGGFNNGNYVPKDITLLVYPLELKSAPHQNQADLLLIQQFEYIPVNKKEFLTPKTQGQKSVFKTGLGADPDARFNQIKTVGPSVTLPMPQSFNERKGVQFGEDTMNVLAAGLTQDVMQNMGEYGGLALAGAAVGGGAGLLSGKAPGFSLGGFSGMTKFAVGARAIKGAAEMTQNSSGSALLSTTVSSLMLKAAGMNVSAETILARGAGIIPNPNMELLFRSPELRTFGFAYRLTARSRAEGEEIRRIIRFFKQGMSPKRQSGENNYFLKTPNMFRIKFRTIKDKNGSDRNKGMPKFKTCALKGFTTDYSPDQMWSAYEDGQPVSVNIMMEFGELSPIYANDYADLPDDDIGF